MGAREEFLKGLPPLGLSPNGCPNGANQCFFFPPVDPLLEPPEPDDFDAADDFEADPDDGFEVAERLTVLVCPDFFEGLETLFIVGLDAEGFGT